MLWAGRLARWGNRLITLAAGLLLGALALYGAWSLWDIAATRRAALPGETLRFKPLAAAPEASASAALPPSKAATRFSSTSCVELVSLP